MPRKRLHSYEQYKKKWYRRLSIWARELWDGLIDFADDEGFGSADPVDLKADIFRDDDLSLEKVEEFLQELVKAQADDPMVMIFKCENHGEQERYYWLPNFFNFQPQPDYPTPSKIANLLIHIGKLDRGDAVSTHRKFCCKSAGRRQRRARKTPSTHRKKSNGVGVGLGVGLGVGIGDGVGVGEDKVTPKTFVELFNTTCPSLQKIEETTKTRSDKIKTRLKEHPDLGWWTTVFERADKMEFTYEKGLHKGKVWRPSFDWLIENDNNAVKVAEGHYENKKKGTWRD